MTWTKFSTGEILPTLFPMLNALGPFSPPAVLAVSWTRHPATYFARKRADRTTPTRNTRHHIRIQTMLLYPSPLVIHRLPCACVSSVMSCSPFSQFLLHTPPRPLRRSPFWHSWLRPPHSSRCLVPRVISSRASSSMCIEPRMPTPNYSPPLMHPLTPCVFCKNRIWFGTASPDLRVLTSSPPQPKILGLPSILRAPSKHRRSLTCATV